MPGTTTKSRDNLGQVQGAIRDLGLNHNKAIDDVDALRLALTTDVLQAWFGVGANGGTTPLARGSTDTQLANAAFVGSINGVAFSKGAVASTTFGALGTVPLNTWAVIAVDCIANGTLSFLSGALNYSTGYASEAAALAAAPARVTAKVRLGYLTLLTAVGQTFVFATDALFGGAAGHVASATNFYPMAGVLTPTGTAKVGGANGILIPTVLSIGGTDTNLQSTAFTYNANGLTNIPKVAVAAGTALGALGTVPAGKWAVIAANIDAAGAITFQSGTHNYDTGYGTEALALADTSDAVLVVPAGKCRMGHFTLQTKDANTAWIAGTDALAGGASGNPASLTKFYPVAGITLQSGFTAGKIGDENGKALAV